MNTRILLTALLLGVVATTATASPLMTAQQLVSMVKDDDQDAAPEGDNDDRIHRRRHGGPLHGRHSKHHGGGKKHHGPCRRRHHGGDRNESAACRKDLDQLCPGVRGPKAVHDCLDDNKVGKLSPSCRKEQPCLADAVKYCHDARGPAHHQCMIEHNASLSPMCRTAIAQRKDHGPPPHHRGRGKHHGHHRSGNDDDDDDDCMPMEGDEGFDGEEPPHSSRGFGFGAPTAILGLVAVLVGTFVGGICVGRNSTCCGRRPQRAVAAGEGGLPVTAPAVTAAAPPAYSRVPKEEQRMDAAVVPSAPPPAQSLAAPLLKDDLQARQV